MIYHSNTINTIDDLIPAAQPNEFLRSVSIYKEYMTNLKQLNHINKLSIYDNFHVFSLKNGTNMAQEWIKDFNKKKSQISTKQSYQLTFILKRYDKILNEINDKSYNSIIKNINHIIIDKSMKNIDNYINNYKKIKTILQKKYSNHEHFTNALTLLQMNLNILFLLKKVQNLCEQIRTHVPISNNIMTLSILTYLINDKFKINSGIESLLKNSNFNEIISKFMNNIHLKNDNKSYIKDELLKQSDINSIIKDHNNTEIILNTLYEILTIISNSL